MIETLLTVNEIKERLNFNGKVLMFGASGLVGERFVEMYDGKFLTPSHSELDITDAEAVRAYIEKEKPDVIINFAAYTNVNGAEAQRVGDKFGECWQENVVGVQNILDAIDPEKTHFIQISTEMVFDCSKVNPGPYDEDSDPETDPEKLTLYGYTKAEAERLVKKRLGNRATILRINNPVRKEFDKKKDYFRGPWDKYIAGKLYPLYSNKSESITYIDEACVALRKIIEGNHYGVFHASSSDLGSPYEIVTKYIRARTKREVSLREGIVDSKDARRYPPYCGLKVSKTEQTLGMKFSSIDQIIEALLK